MDKSTFFGSMDFDSSDRIIEKNFYRYALNCHIGTSEAESTGTVTNVKGNTLITFTLPGGQNTCIGAFEDKKDNSVIYFVHNANGNHQILRYFPTINVILTIVNSSLLNFSTSFLITGIAFIEGKLLFWTDDNNEPGFIDTTALLTGGYPATLTAQHIQAIPYAPNFPPTAAYSNDANKKVNNLKNSLFQFKYQYVYKDNRISAWSPISKLPTPSIEIIFGSSMPSFIDNRIDITLNTGDSIVKQIRVAARLGNLGDFFLIETLDKAELFLANDANYTFGFFNDGLYPSIELQESNKLFDFLPKKAKALSPIDGNRMAYGNGVDGFDQVPLDIRLTPIIHPLSDLPSSAGGSNFSVTAGSTNLSMFNAGVPVVGEAYRFQFVLRKLLTTGGFTVAFETKKYEYIELFLPGDTMFTVFARLKAQMEADTTLTNAEFVNVLVSTQKATFVNPVTISLSTTSPATLSMATNNWAGFFTPGYPEFTSVSLVANSSNSMKRAFKSGATHEFGIIYYDSPNRSGTVNISQDSKVYVPFQSERAIQDGWVDMEMQINHTPPIWATHYQVAYTKNQNIARFLITAESVTVTGNKTTMVLTNLGLFQTDNPGTLLSYDFTVGDRIRFIQNRNTLTFLTTYVDLEVSAFDSATNTLTFQTDSNITNGTGYLVEIYTPQKTITEKFYYEIGECYAIGDAGLSTRYHTANTQTQKPGVPAIITLENQGDVYFRSRLFTATGVYLEDPSYSDLFLSNYCNVGRPNVYDSGASEQRRIATVWYSEPFIPDTNINGLGSFFDTNFEEYDKSYDSIQYLFQENSNLLMFQELKVGAILINQRVFSDTQGQGVVSATQEVLSTPARYYAGEYGIGKHPESFASYGNRKYFVDYQRGAVLRLSTDGITPISEYKAHTYFTQRFKDILNAGVKKNIYGVYDVKYGRYILSLDKKISDTTTIGSGAFQITLPIPSFERETIAFDEVSNGWKMFFSFQPEFMCGANLDIVSFKDGSLYLHDSNSLRGNFYGVQYPMKINFVHNEAPANMKVYNSLELDSNAPFAMEMTNQFGQKTSLIESDFENIENAYWAALWKDENTPNVSNPLLEGDDMRCHTAVIKLTNSLTTFVKLFAVGIKTQMSELTNR